jgi:hypothetical protein
MGEKHFQNNVLRMYGFDDLETISSTSSRQSTPVPLDSIEDTKPKQQITIREYYPSKDMPSLMVNRSVSSSLSSQQATEDIDYEQFIGEHPELFNDPNPEIINKPNPNQVTYQQNVSVRYLVPPTPPPPGPLIIRGTNYYFLSSRITLFLSFHSLEIIPPQQTVPPPLVIKQQEPSPSTPSPIIFREAPPTPPPHQEAKIITKTLPQPSPSPQRVIFERKPPVYSSSNF